MGGGGKNTQTPYEVYMMSHKYAQKTRSTPQDQRDVTLVKGTISGGYHSVGALHRYHWLGYDFTGPIM